jgi:xylan 1,4-beta-xylosidase
MTARFTSDLRTPTTPLVHVWEHTVGSGHATLALRADWQRQLVRCHRELGFHRVRFHGLLCDDLGTLVCERDRLVYSFYNADAIIDFLLSIGMTPFVELSFMPATLASGDRVVFHYRGNVTPPKDYDAWQTLIEKLVGHWVARYGLAEVSSWLFEVWNEPNLEAFWAGSQDDYFKLYRHAARAIKNVDPSLQVGGPATAMNAWIDQHVARCVRDGVPLDFVSTHHYPTDAFGQPGDDTITQLAASRRSVLREEAVQARARAGDRPLYYTEWCTSSNPFDDLHDQPYAAAFVVKTAMEAHAIVDGYSYWTFSDIFEENYFSSMAFHGGFGLLTVDGVPKPSYRAFELLHRLGTRFVAVAGYHETVDTWIARADTRITILVANGALPRHPLAAEHVTIELAGIGAIASAMVERIDDDHANARRAWVEMGSPERPLPHQVDALETASALSPQPLPCAVDAGCARFDLVMPANGVALVTLEIAS